MKSGIAPSVCLLLLASPLLAGVQVDYLRDIKPLLARHCYECHGAQKQRSGLRLDSATAIRQGGNSGPGIIPGKSAASKLIKAVTGAENTKRMPPKEPRLTSEQIDLLKAWIDQGARSPAKELTE